MADDDDVRKLFDVKHRASFYWHPQEPPEEAIYRLASALESVEQMLYRLNHRELGDEVEAILEELRTMARAPTPPEPGTVFSYDEGAEGERSMKREA
jgi:hypothetical protein